MGIGILACAGTRDAVLRGQRPRTDPLLVWAVEVPSLLVGYVDGLTISVVIRIEG